MVGVTPSSLPSCDVRFLRKPSEDNPVRSNRWILVSSFRTNQEEDACGIHAQVWQREASDEALQYKMQPLDVAIITEIYKKYDLSFKLEKPNYWYLWEQWITNALTKCIHCDSTQIFVMKKKFLASVSTDEKAQYLLNKSIQFIYWMWNCLESLNIWRVSGVSLRCRSRTARTRRRRRSADEGWRWTWASRRSAGTKSLVASLPRPQEAPAPTWTPLECKLHKPEKKEFIQQQHFKSGAGASWGSWRQRRCCILGFERYLGLCGRVASGPCRPTSWWSTPGTWSLPPSAGLSCPRCYSGRRKSRRVHKHGSQRLQQEQSMFSFNSSRISLAAGKLTKWCMQPLQNYAKTCPLVALWRSAKQLWRHNYTETWVRFWDF